MKLDLGSGPRPREGFVGVDIVSLENVVAFDLVSGNKWPWKENEVEELASSHFIEHIAADYVDVWKSVDGVAANIPQDRPEPNRRAICKVQKDRLLFFFDEAFRVTQPGGLFHLTWPALKSTDAFRDPTHRRFLPLEFLHYLSKQGRDSMGLQHYEASCNWVTVGDALIHTEPLPDGSEGWSLDDLGRLWDVQRAFSVTLRAEK